MAIGTGNLPNPGMSFSPFAILTAEELNDLVANVDSLADGTGVGDGAIDTTQLANQAVTLAKLDTETFTKRRNHTTNVNVANAVTCTGWTYIVGDNTSVVDATVTFPVTFATPPIVVVAYAGASATPPTLLSDLTANPGNNSRSGMASGITTTKFELSIGSSNTLGSGAYYGATWIAIGTVS